VANARKNNWKTLVAVAMMLLALFAYVASLDESDPEALPQASGAFDSNSP
jgi:hypothetical protein